MPHMHLNILVMERKVKENTLHTKKEENMLVIWKVKEKQQEVWTL
jgi:hypothetical protein